MAEKSLAYILSCFARYPRTQQALRELHERSGEALTQNAAKMIQIIALEAIPGDFVMTPEDVEAFNNDPALLEQIHAVVRVFMREQCGGENQPDLAAR